MQFISHDPEYNRMMLALKREEAAALRARAQQLRLQSIELRAMTARLRLTYGQLFARTTAVLSASAKLAA